MPEQASPSNDPARLDEVQAFLSERHRSPVSSLEVLSGGFWSTAFGYSAGGRALVLRIGANREWFEIDRDAMAYSSPDLPVPEVLEVGDALGGAYAISVRHFGRFLETVEASEAAIVGPTIVRLLAALKAVSTGTPTGNGWRAWLLDELFDDPRRRVSGWREKIAADGELEALFLASESRIRDLIQECPDRQDLLHRDLLHSNVLVSEDASHVNAVFSWKCSMRGDLLYDVAWCTFWSWLHPGIAAADVYGRVLREHAFADALEGAALRHHCYELHIGTTHLGWNIWTGNEEALRANAARLSEILARGPLPHDR